MKRVLCVLLVFVGLKAISQNQQILYNFDKIPQTLLLNPGGETTYKYHIGIPVLSGASANVNISGITVADIFRNDNVSIFAGTDFNIRVREALKKVSKDDYAYANTRVEILNGGYKINSRDYLSAGFYSEADIFFNIPKDIITLLDEGNAAYVNKAFSLSQINVRADVLGVLHAGISRRFNNRFMAGARLKMYSGVLNITSTGNEGTFTTRRTTPDFYEHILNGVDVEVNSSGIYNENDKVDIKRSLFGGNFGLGLDIGFTYYYNKKWQFTASVLDVGFINYSKKNRNVKVAGSYTFSGINLKYNDINKNYWKELKEDIKANVLKEEDKKSYSVMRPLKVNGSLRYSFGNSRNMSNCHDTSYKDFYDNAVGGQLYTVFRPNGPRFALTGFYERKFTKHLNTKVTYTIDDFSYTNFGLGASVNVWKLNVYAMADNIFALSDVADAHRASLQFGVNFVIN